MTTVRNSDFPFVTFNSAEFVHSEFGNMSAAHASTSFHVVIINLLELGEQFTLTNVKDLVYHADAESAQAHMQERSDAFDVSPEGIEAEQRRLAHKAKMDAKLEAYRQKQKERELI